MENTDRKDQDTLVDGDKAALKVYEIGYHILPSVAEENLAAEVGNVKGMLESNGALFISEEFPKLRPLAYTLSKAIDGRTEDFDQAYFGWVKFEMSPESIETVKKSLEGNRNILRHLLVETVRENTLSFPKQAVFRKDEEGGMIEEPKEELTAEDEAKVNQAIDELVKE